MSVSALTHLSRAQMQGLLVKQLRRVGLAYFKLVSVAMLLITTSCVSTDWYESPPVMPQAISPVIHAEKLAGQLVKFEWSRTESTEYFEFHIFNGESTDIAQYMTLNLLPKRICNEQTCSLTLSLDLPVSERHAWRVRSGNMAGLSTWTRSLFTVKAL